MFLGVRYVDKRLYLYYRVWQVAQILKRNWRWKTMGKKDMEVVKGLKRVTEISVETAKSIKGGKTCNCSCQTQNEKAATTLSTYTA